MFFKYFLVLCFVKCFAVDYKIGSKVFVTQVNVDKVFEKLGPLGFSREAVLQRMIYARSVVLALKLSKQVPEVIKTMNLVGYEADEAILAQYMQMLENNFSASGEEISKKKSLYSQIKAKNIYLVREIVVKPEDSASLVGYKNIVAASSDKAREFGALARKHSIAKSGQKSGKIGYYNPDYSSQLLFSGSKIGDLVISKNGNTLYFIEAVVEFKMPSDQDLIKEIIYEKMSSHIATLMEHYPIEVAEIA